MLLTNCRVRLIQFTSITISSHSSGHLFRLLAHHHGQLQFAVFRQVVVLMEVMVISLVNPVSWRDEMRKQWKRSVTALAISLVTEECQTEAAIICPNSGRDSIWHSMSTIASNCQPSMQWKRHTVCFTRVLYKPSSRNGQPNRTVCFNQRASIVQKNCRRGHTHTHTHSIFRATDVSALIWLIVAWTTKDCFFLCLRDYQNCNTSAFSPFVHPIATRAFAGGKKCGELLTHCKHTQQRQNKSLSFREWERIARLICQQDTRPTDWTKGRKERVHIFFLASPFSSFFKSLTVWLEEKKMPSCLTLAKVRSCITLAIILLLFSSNAISPVLNECECEWISCWLLKCTAEWLNEITIVCSVLAVLLGLFIQYPSIHSFIQTRTDCLQFLVWLAIFTSCVCCAVVPPVSTKRESCLTVWVYGNVY